MGRLKNFLFDEYGGDVQAATQALDPEAASIVAELDALVRAVVLDHISAAPDEHARKRGVAMLSWYDSMVLQRES
jgi:hypothetical protein